MVGEIIGMVKGQRVYHRGRYGRRDHRYGQRSNTK